MAVLANSLMTPSLHKLLTVEGIGYSNTSYDAQCLYPVWASGLDDAVRDISRLSVDEFCSHAAWIASILFDGTEFDFSLDKSERTFLRNCTEYRYDPEQTSDSRARDEASKKSALVSAKKACAQRALAAYLAMYEDEDMEDHSPDEEVLRFFALEPDEMMALWYRFRWNMVHSLEAEPEHLWNGDMKYHAERLWKGMQGVWAAFAHERLALETGRVMLPVNVEFPNGIQLMANWDGVRVFGGGFERRFSFRKDPRPFWRDDERGKEVLRLLADAGITPGDNGSPWSYGKVSETVE